MVVWWKCVIHSDRYTHPIRDIICYVAALLLLKLLLLFSMGGSYMLCGRESAKNSKNTRAQIKQTQKNTQPSRIECKKMSITVAIRINFGALTVHFSTAYHHINDNNGNLHIATFQIKILNNSRLYYFSVEFMWLRSIQIMYASSVLYFHVCVFPF